MRRILFALTLLLAMPVMAADNVKTPSGLQPLPDVPPPPPGINLDAGPDVEERIVIRPEGPAVEYRSGGKLYMVKITPKIGAPYYLVDQNGDGTFAKQDGPAPGIRPPQWIIHQF